MSSPAQPVLPLERSALSPLTFIASVILFLSLHGMAYTGHYLWSLRQPPAIFGWFILVVQALPVAVAVVVLLTGRFRTLLLVIVSLMLAISGYFMVTLVYTIAVRMAFTPSQVTLAMVKELPSLLLVLSLLVLLCVWVPRPPPPVQPGGSHADLAPVPFPDPGHHPGTVWRSVSLIGICLVPLLCAQVASSVRLYEHFSSGTDRLQHLLEAATVFLTISYGLIAAIGLLLRPQPRLLWILIACISTAIVFEVFELSRQYESSVRLLPTSYARASDKLNLVFWLSRTPWWLLTSLIATLLLALRPPPWLSGRMT